MEPEKPNLTFACELDTNELIKLFSDGELIPKLRNINARVSLALLDFSDQRAEIVKRLSNAGVPVIAWLLLPETDGYWFNLDNAQQAARCYGQFKLWTEEHNLQWDAIGLDIEPDIRLIHSIRKDKWQALRFMYHKFANASRHKQAVQDYRALIIQMRVDGYKIESYQFPYIIDDRKAGSTMLQRLTGVVDIPADKEVLMLYSSFMRDLGPGILVEYGKNAQAISVGSTGGGVDLEGVIDNKPLTWEELERGLLFAKAYTQELFIFSLEGCYHQGFLERITLMDWTRDVTSTPDRRVAIARKGLQATLWLLARPYILIAGMIFGVWFTSVRSARKHTSRIELPQ
ncbi:MAG: hypothetical protein HPY76_13055, partial [Anaerolineae bacterium]|nr:hypothetical protein [Anaerolineae bacterium]